MVSKHLLNFNTLLFLLHLFSDIFITYMCVTHLITPMLCFVTQLSLARAVCVTMGMTMSTEA